MAMDTKEHLLLIELFAQQNLFLRQLCTALTNEGVVTEEQIKLLGAFQRADVGHVTAIVDRTRRQYLKEAKKLGVETGLEEPPENL